MIISDAPDAITIGVKCAACDARVDLPSTRTVYGLEGPFDPPCAIAASGWRALGPYYCCPRHVGLLTQAQSDYRAWREYRAQEHARLVAEWDAGNPAPSWPWEA